MRSRTTWQFVVPFTQAWVMLVSAAVWGQAPPDVPPPASAPAPDDAAPPPPDRPRFRLDATDLYVGFETEFENRRVKSTVPYRRDTTHENHDLRFIESAGITLGGFVYDPNLLEYRAQLEFGLTQGRFREDINRWSDTEDDNGFLIQYDVNVDLFKSKPISLNVYARRADVRVPRRFLPSLREEQTETGASALIVGDKFTTEVGFSLRDVERHGNRDDEDDEELDNSRFYIDHKFTFSDTHKLRLLYEHEHDESNYQGSRYSFETQRDEARLEHEIAFGPGNKHRLDTYLRYNAEKGDLARDELELVPRLTLQHTDNFKTIHRYSLYQYDQGGIKVTQNKFDTEAIWDVTDKLRLSADGYAMHEHVENDLDTSQFGGLIDAAYRQPTSLGELSANANFGIDEARTSGDAGIRYVHGEAHPLGGSRPVFLRETGVIPGSVFAFNATRTRLYAIGTDYTVVFTAGRAVVARTWTGRIADGEVVYFDYAYKVPAHGEIQSYRTDLLIEHRFTFGLTPYYALEGRWQETEYSRATPWVRDNQDRHRLGARFDRER
ncbi:MAG: hypothetical protein HY718_12210 [Planctomycetes bacterium]|nr:hypothetical protein [Planctomycetota bacterium]